MEIRELGPGDLDIAMGAADLFDSPPRHDATAKFLAAPSHHLLVAFEDGVPAGFITGVETTHPDKGTEMFLYEMGVGDAHRRRGIGRALVRRLAELARERGCYGMWVATDEGNVAALATYEGGGGTREKMPSIVLTWDLT